VWAVFQSLALCYATVLFPDRAAEVVLRGPAYAEEMLHWVRSGEGPEGSPRLYLPIHLRHFLAFGALSAISVGALALAMGTVLLNYMNFYVVELVRASAEPSLAVVFGWPVWAVLRVVGFVGTGVATAAAGLGMYQRISGKTKRVRFPARLFALGLGLVVVDALLKAVLAPAWRGILLRALEGG
jgi:hypothetical protein